MILADPYKILEVNSQSSTEEIKKSYRRLAKKFHPDVNKAADAQAKFIEINEAYEFLINKRHGLTYDSKRHKYTRTSKTKSWEEWSRNEKEKANKRARYYSAKKYRDFINSTFYKESQAIEDFASFGVLVLLFGLIVIFPVFLSYTYDLPGLYISLALAFFTIQVWGPMLVSGRLPGFTSISEGFRLILRLFPVRVFMACFLFFVVFFTVGFHTFISIYEIFLYLVVFSFLLFYLTRNRIGQQTLSRKILRSISYALVLFSALLCINYFISFSPVEEVYTYSSTREASRHGRSVKGSMILLNNNAFDSYPSVRFFFDYDSIPGNRRKITYRVKKGILFYKVYTERYF
jgi:hypothetical protein